MGILNVMDDINSQSACTSQILDVIEASKGSTQFSDVKVCMRGLAAVSLHVHNTNVGGVFMFIIL